MKRLACFLFLAAPMLAADAATIEKGRAQEKRQCIQCHGLRIIHVQRLPRGAWERELDKMVRWGAVITEREALLEYLAANYGDDKPLPVLPRSADAPSAGK